jgi:hypothetical protein
MITRTHLGGGHRGKGGGGANEGEEDGSKLHLDCYLYYYYWIFEPVGYRRRRTYWHGNVLALQRIMPLGYFNLRAAFDGRGAKAQK